MRPSDVAGHPVRPYQRFYPTCGDEVGIHPTAAEEWSMTLVMEVLGFYLVKRLDVTGVKPWCRRKGLGGGRCHNT